LKKLVRGNFLLLINSVLILLVVGSSYYRFMVLHDYQVSYAGDCDSEVQSCYIGCDDEEEADACESTYYYSIITRQADYLYDLCGRDVYSCDAAFECQPDDPSCTIDYCDATSSEDECTNDITS